MDAMHRLLLLPGVLLFAGAPAALAESPLMPDPIAPAVIGRPLDQIRPARVARPKPMSVRPASPERTGARPAAAAPAKLARKTSPAQAKAAPLALAAPAAAVATPVTQDVPGQRAAKKTLDDRFDASVHLGEVGKGTHFARKPLAPGAYFADRHREAVRKYYEEHPASGQSATWRIGEAVPRGVSVKSVPAALLPNLPALPPGHRYVQLGGDVVMIAEGSKMVVDGISRSAR
jgi:hypothetical protein